MTMDNSALLHLATKANRLAARVSRESELHRIAGRLIRNPSDLRALARSAVYAAKTEGSVFSDALKTGTGFLLLQFAIERVSYLCWEDLWNDKHPGRFGQAWDGKDFELMSVWRKEVRAIIKECNQEWMLLVRDVEEYIERLIDSGASKEAAGELAAWYSKVRYTELPERGVDESS